MGARTSPIPVQFGSGIPDKIRDYVFCLPFNDFDAIEQCVKDHHGEVAAVLVEPCLGNIAGIEPKDGFLDHLRSLCNDHNIVLIFDEIQTGMGRTGSTFASERFECKPDLLTIAKGLANGIPSGAVLATEEVALEIKPGELGSTFGGGPVACAAGLAVLDAIESEKLIENALYLESVAHQMLITGPVSSVRGYGLLLGLETNVPARAVTRFLFENKILAGTSADPHVVRLMPPLTIGEKELENLATVLAKFPV